MRVHMVIATFDADRSMLELYSIVITHIYDCTYMYDVYKIEHQQPTLSTGSLLQ